MFSRKADASHRHWRARMNAKSVIAVCVLGLTIVSLAPSAVASCPYDPADCRARIHDLALPPLFVVDAGIEGVPMVAASGPLYDTTGAATGIGWCSLLSPYKTSTSASRSETRPA